jgi:hypothetical protein
MKMSTFGLDRRDEIRELFKLSVEELTEKSQGHFVVKQTLDELYDYTAEQMAGEFRASTAQNGPVAFIMPVGPVQPYPLMAQKINDDRID